MARDLTADPPGRNAGYRVRRPRRAWIVVLLLGVAAIVAGTALVVGPLFSVWSRGQTDKTALSSWQGALVGPNSHGGNADAHKTVGCGSSATTDYALVKFSSPAQYGYAGVAGDGTWDLLNQRSMVHYHGTANPGDQGNVIIAFHREPDYEHIDQLVPGGTITIQDRACHTYVYRVTGRWDLPPSKVTQLGPTTGHELTMITCDPWWQDYNRLVWRAELVQGAGSSPAPGAASSGAAAANPTF